MDDGIELLVTQIKELTKKRSLVYINYEPAFALYNYELRKYHISADKVVGRDVYDELTEEILKKRAVVRAMALLKSRDYTRKALEDKLKEGFYPQGCIEHAVEYVSGFGYVNDERYAENYVNFKAGSKSRRQIEQALRMRGLDEDTIRNACDAYYSDNEDAELAQVRSYIAKKNFDAEHADFKEIQKLKTALFRKGYSVSTINKALGADDGILS